MYLGDGASNEGTSAVDGGTSAERYVIAFIAHTMSMAAQVAMFVLMFENKFSALALLAARILR